MGRFELAYRKKTSLPKSSTGWSNRALEIKNMLPDKQQIYNEWTFACEQMKATTEAHYLATCELADAKTILKTIRTAIIADTDPKELGSNEAQREANLAKRTEIDASRVTSLERTHARASHLLELARLEKERVKEIRRIVLGMEGVA